MPFSHAGLLAAVFLEVAWPQDTHAHHLSWPVSLLTLGRIGIRLEPLNRLVAFYLSQAPTL